MITQIIETGCEKIREILIDNGFVESQNNMSDISLKKDTKEIRIPKIEILPPIFIKYVISVSRISKKKLA